MDRPIAVRRWAKSRTRTTVKTQESMVPVSSCVPDSSKNGEHRPDVDADRKNEMADVAADLDQKAAMAVSKVPVIVLLDEENEPEEGEIVKTEEEGRGGEEQASAAMEEEEEEEAEEMEEEEEEEEEEGETEYKDEEALEDRDNAKKTKMSDAEDEPIVDPDELWEAPASGTITTYTSPADWKWVEVSRKRLEAGKRGQEPDLRLALASSSGGSEAIQVYPINQALPSANIGGEASDMDVEEDLDELFPNRGDVTGIPEDGNDPRLVVSNRLMIYEKLRVRYLRDGRRGDLSVQAAKSMNERSLWVNRNKNIGPVPGVEVGDIFFFRVAMCIVGLHQQMQAGISCFSATDKTNAWSEILACSLVLSGGYEDDMDSGETFTYTGQGGRDAAGGKRQLEHQKLERGNLGLANSAKHDLPVRVVRGCLDKHSPSGRIYSYDGLYKVEHYWCEMGFSGFMVYKFFLRRLPGQPELGSRIVRFSGKLASKQEVRQSVVCDDLSNGLERIPICAVNSVDASPSSPPSFKYVTKVIPPPGYVHPPLPRGCRCVGKCSSAEDCECVALNGSIPYTDGGALTEFKPIVFECGPMCRCPPSCPNKVSQQGQQRKLEVFKTEKMGWGVRSWEAIPYGSFVCEYVGELIDNEEAERRVGQDEYIFDIDCIKGSQTRGVDISSFFGEEAANGQLVQRVEDGHMSIDAGSSGNVSRFINHSCDPNMFVQCVFYDHHDMACPHVMMFAMKNIKPFEELFYDYGYVIDSVHDHLGDIKKKRCYCGTRRCRKRLY